MGATQTLSSTAAALPRGASFRPCAGSAASALIVRSREVALSGRCGFASATSPLCRAVGRGLHMLGATVIESDDAGPISVRSALELLGTAYALHPAFGEAEIRGSWRRRASGAADNVPKIVVRGRTVYVNGLYRHGFLLAPVLSVLVAAYLATGAVDGRVFKMEAAT